MKPEDIFNKQVFREPVIEEISVSQPIMDIFGLIGDRKYSCLLLSCGKQKFSPYSYFGYDPFLVISSKNKRVTVVLADKRYNCVGNPFDVLKKVLHTYRLKSIPDIPFTSGGIGYLSYDLCHFIEELPDNAVDDLNLPDCCFIFYSTVFIHDILKNRFYLSSADFMEKNERRAYKSARENVERLKRIISQDKPTDFPVPGRGNVDVKSNFTKKEYLDAVKRVKKYIIEGDIYQVNLSQRFSAKYKGQPYSLFHHLCEINPAPFSAYLNMDGFNILSSSPERFLKMSDGWIETRPMKGTRPRGRNSNEDTSLYKELLASRKDEAELAMIVDLERNDLGKVSEFGSVRVSEHKNAEIYPTVFQMTSTVNAKLKNDYDCIDLVKAAFPGGSITGCPKIRAMEIIDELEPTRRGIYTGAIGYLGFDNTMDISIVIRTIILKGEDAFFQVGGGIVADSDPAREYDETLHKAKALIFALRS